MVELHDHPILIHCQLETLQLNVGVHFSLRLLIGSKQTIWKGECLLSFWEFGTNCSSFHFHQRSWETSCNVCHFHLSWQKVFHEEGLLSLFHGRFTSGFTSRSCCDQLFYQPPQIVGRTQIDLVQLLCVLSCMEFQFKVIPSRLHRKLPQQFLVAFRNNDLKIVDFLQAFFQS